jgi:hypothetical protein
MPGAPFIAFLSLAMSGYRLRKQATVYLPLPTDSVILGGVQHGIIVRNAVEESRDSQPIPKHLEPLLSGYKLNRMSWLANASSSDGELAA